MRLRNPLLFVLVTLLGMAPAAHAAGAPNISLDKDAPGSVLFGGDSEVTLTASNPSGQPTGYNLTFRDVLPAGTSYVRGSSPIEPRVLRDAPAAGQTTLIFENVSDVSGASSYSLTYGVRHSTSVYAVGDTYTNQAGAYVNDNPRYVPKFSATGTPIGPSATSHTGYASDSAATQISAISIEKSEPSREGELLRGAHDQQTVYTLTVRNNAVAPTEDVVVDDYLPAGLEFLGCGTTDNTTDAATNPGEKEEYAGSGPLNTGNAPPAPDCVDPTLVETVLTDPDGGGPRPLAVYTHVRWTTAVGTLKPGSSFSLEYVAAIPIRENTTSWPGGMTPTPEGLTQAANLDNNSGTETADEQALVNYARATGDYDGTVAVFDDVSLTRSAEDLAIHKSVDDDTIQGDVSTWTLDLETSEYRYVDDVRVTDTLPDGLCPLGGVNHEASPQSTECDPTRDVPSSDYTAVTENSNGTWTLRWDEKTVPELARMGPSDTFSIAFPTRTRAFYQDAFADDDPVLTRDSWVNRVSVLGADYLRCVPADPDCTRGGREIDADETGGTDDVDASSAGQSAGGVKIDKRVAESQAGPVSCDKGTYVDGPAPRYGPGDRVCWTVRVDFANLLDSGSPRVTDFLPPGSVYEAGSAEPTPDNDVKATLDDSQPELLTWDLGPVVDSGGLTFEWRFSTLVTKSSATSSGDVPGNLMKFAYANSAGTTFPLRDQADFEREEAELSLLKGVRDINDAPAGGLAANTDNRQVQGGDTVTYRVDITNDGRRDAEDVEVWDDLPAGIECSALTVLNVSHRGTCNALTDSIEWGGLALAAGAQDTLTYDLVIPSDVSPGQTLTNTAGVRTYTSATNTGGSFRYIPEDNIDPKVTALGTPNAAAAGDGSSVFTDPVTLTKTRTTEINESDNGVGDAAIGEQVDYELTATIPAGTTLYNTPELTDALGSRLTYMAGTATATLNGTSLPTGGLTLSDTGNTISVTFPTTYTNSAGSGDDILVVRFTAKLNDVTTNHRLAGGTPVPNTGTLVWDDQDANARSVSGSVNTNVVEPVLGLAKNEDDADDAVDPGQTVHYTVTATNGSGTRISRAHDLVAVDTLPAGLTPVNAGTPVADGGTVDPDGGVWNAGARTITWSVASLAPGASVALDYDVKVDDPAVVGTTFPNRATLTGTSLPDKLDDDGGERGPSSIRNTGYTASAADLVRLGTATTTKTVSAASATIGEERTFTVDAVIPAGVQFYDTTVIDTLPDGLDYDGTTSITCLAPCSPNIAGSELPAELQAGGETRLGWFLGDLAPARADRTVRIVYRAHVDDTFLAPATPLAAGDPLDNSVATYSNMTDNFGTPSKIPATASFDERTPSDTARVTVTEPNLSLDKSVSGAGSNDTRPTQPGDSFLYTVAVTNDGDSPAYDVEVSDQPDAELLNVALTDGAAYVTSDGWTTADPDIHWLIPGPIAPGATVNLRYTADLVPSAQLAQGQLADNTADVDRYWAVAEAERTANRHDYREYTDVAPDTVTLEVELPQLTVTKTTGASGNPDSANAEVGQPFPWRVVIENTSSEADALNVDVSDVLPPNWTYVTGSASFAPGGAAEPTVTTASTGDTLTWSNVGDLAPGGQIVLTFSARPRLAAATTPGQGAANPHQNKGSADAEDADGASASADGPYADSDTAQAILQMPALSIAKTPDGGVATAGATTNFSIQVNNTGAGTARGVEVTDVLPPGATYTPGAATATPAAGFSEASVTAGPGAGETTMVWEIASIAPGAGVTITVPVRPSASLASGTTLVNDASVLSDELPTPASDTGSLVVATSADVSVQKTSSQTAVTAGETIDYVLRAENAGPSDALAVVVSDDLPANVSFVSAEAPCTYSGGTVSCTLGRLAPGASRELDLRVRVLSGATGSVVNPAEVVSDTPDPDPSDNNDEVTVPIGATADLRIDKSTVAPTYIQGGQITYDIAVTNDGPSDAAGVTVTDALPAGISFVSATSDRGSCSHTAGTVTCTVGALAAGATASIDLVVSADDAGPLLNEASVSSSTIDSDSGNDEDDASVTVAPAADLAITKTGDATVAAGGQASYSLTVTNNGPSDATGVRAVDTLPSGTSFVSSSPAGACSAAGDIVTCDIDGLADGASETVDLVVDVPFALGDQTLTNTAVVTGDQADTNSSNDSDSANTSVGPSADLSLVKSVGAATAGGTVTWTLVVSNRGPSAATGVSLDDSLPPGVSFQSATPSQGSCSQAGGTVGCTLGTIAPGASGQVTIVAGVPADLPVGTPVSNTAGVTADQPDGTPGDNDDSAVTTVQPPPPSGPNLSVDKRASVARPRLGVLFDYVIDVRNAGPGRATDVELTDTLSGAVRLGSVLADGRGRCSRRGQAIRCSLGDLAAGESTRVRLRVRALRPGRLDNTAGVTGDESDVDPSDNRDSERVRVVAPPAAYSVSKRAARGTVRGGELVRFTIVVRMKQGAAAAMRLCDRLPDGLVFVRARGATFRSGQACWGRAYLAPGRVLRLKVVARAQRGFSRRRVTNIAVVTGQNLARRSARAPVTITPVFGGAPLGVTG